MKKHPSPSWTLGVVCCLSVLSPAAAQSTDVDRLVTALLGDTPMIADLQQLTDEIGGRATGSEANLKSVEWGLARFHQAGVAAAREEFNLPLIWLEGSATAEIRGDVSFPVRVVAMPFSTSTPAAGLTAPVVDGGRGGEADLARLGESPRGAFLLVETDELFDIDGLFREYAEAVEIEQRAFAAGVAGVVYMSSRPNTLVYRHNASFGPENDRPMMVMERQSAGRVLRLLREGRKLTLNARIELRSGPSDKSANVIAEIPGREFPDEVVLIGAHLDSWDLGTGANDNGCNVAMMIDIARQMKRLGIQPRRTIRFALWNGEEQGFWGSWDYVKRHRNELDNHVMTLSVDIGSGRINGFFTNGRSELLDPVARALEPVAGLGPFVQVNVPIVGTDNYDFMLEGVANLVANHEPYNYGPNYHAESDTFDKVDLRQLRTNAAIVGALTLAFANMDVIWKRQGWDEVNQLVEEGGLGEAMRGMGGDLWKSWTAGVRGRQRPR